MSTDNEIETILIVDDMLVNLHLLSKILTDHRYKVRAVKTGYETIASVNNELPDLILLDIILPDINGYEVCTQLKANEKTCLVPIIFLSALDKTEDKLRGFEVGGVDFITKPFIVEEVLVRVQTHLEITRQRTQLKKDADFLIQSNDLLNHEIKERKLAEEKIKSLLNSVEIEKSMLESLINSITDEVWFADKDKIYTLANPIAIKTFGLSSNVMIKVEEFISSLNILRPDGTPQSVEEHPTLKALKGEAVFNHEEIVQIPTTGEFRYRRINAAPVKDSDGNIIGAVSVVRDITENKQAQKKIMASEIKYRRLFESAKDGILILDAETGKIVDVNPFLIELLGYSREEFIEKAIWEIGFFKDVAANYDNFLELQQQEYIRYENLPLETADGRKINVEFVSNVYLVNGKKVIQCNIRNISERILAEHRQIFIAKILTILNRPNDWHKIISDILTEIKTFTNFEAVAIRLKEGDDYPYYAVNGLSEIFVSKERFLCSRDKNGDIIYDDNGKPHLECMCGNIISKQTDPLLPFFTTKGSFWSNNTTELLANSTGEELQATTRNHCNGAGYQSVALIPLINSDETIGILQMNDKRTNQFTLEMIHFFEKIAMSIGIAFKRMEIEKQIKESEENLRVILESTNDGILAVDKNNKIIKTNKRFTELWGIPKEIIDSKDENILLNFVLEQLINPIEFLNKVNKLNNTTDSDYDTLFFKDGRIIERSSYHLILANSIYGSVWSFRDITERKRNEKELFIAKERAEQSDKLKTEFLSQMSHEVRTPLNVINGNVEYLSEILNDNIDDEVKQCFNAIGLASERIIRTIEIILNYSELQTGGYKPDLTYIDLGKDIINPLIDEHKRSAEKKGLRITFTNKMDARQIQADEYSIKQIFANLIDNAIKYTNHGYIEILLDINETGNIFVQIKDTGVGMSPEFLSHIYEPFVQEEHGYSRSYDGNGLGLALVEKYCKINNAVIEVESKKNIGSTFNVTFSNPEIK